MGRKSQTWTNFFNCKLGRFAAKQKLLGQHERPRLFGLNLCSVPEGMRIKYAKGCSPSREPKILPFVIVSLS
jgi:hypothetical protein